MPWIETVTPEATGPELRAAIETMLSLYPPEYSAPAPRREGEKSDSIVASHTLIPAALLHAFATYGVLMSPELPLSRAQHEMIATVVSSLNRCRH